MKKKLTRPVSFVLFVFCLITFSLQAQESKQSSYLVGAVPEKDGKVYFHQSFKAHGLSRDFLMDLTTKWIENRNDNDQEISARVVISDENKGLVVATCNEKLVFKSALLMLDQANLNYYIQAKCVSGAVEMEIIRIRYEYDEERLTAEEMISDEVSLSEDGQHIRKYYKKWRIKTIDFAKDLFDDFGRYLNNSQQ